MRSMIGDVVARRAVSVGSVMVGDAVAFWKRSRIVDFPEPLGPMMSAVCPGLSVMSMARAAHAAFVFRWFCSCCVSGSGGRPKAARAARTLVEVCGGSC